jgi:hypothetical protein
MTARTSTLAGGGAVPLKHTATNRVFRACPSRWTRYNRYTPVQITREARIGRLAAGHQRPMGAR